MTVAIGEARRLVRSADGTPVAVYDGGPDTSDRVFLSHATGFCAGAWSALAEYLSCAWTAWDFRGHGRSGACRIPVSWWQMGADVEVVRDLTSASRAVGVGHSMGGASLVMAQLTDSTRFDAFVLFEPIITPPPYGRNPDHLLARLARKRRSEFPSRAEARENYVGKPPFDTWDPLALDGYLESGLVDDANGVRLACTPEFESEVFTAAGAHGVLERIGEIGIPVTVVVGEDTETYPTEWAEELAARFPEGDLVVVAGTGHFGPMEKPAQIAEIIEATWARI